MHLIFFGLMVFRNFHLIKMNGKFYQRDYSELKYIRKNSNFRAFEAYFMFLAPKTQVKFHLSFQKLY